MTRIENCHEPIAPEVDAALRRQRTPAREPDPATPTAWHRGGQSRRMGWERALEGNFLTNTILPLLWVGLCLGGALYAFIVWLRLP